MQSRAKTVAEYLKSLSEGQRKEVVAVRRVVRDNLPAGYVEGMEYGMITYAVPLKRYPDTYNGRPLTIAALAAQKNYNSVYLMSVYGDKSTERWFNEAYAKSGKKLDMGKSCVRFKRAQDLALDVIAETIARVPVEAFLKRVEAARAKRT